MDARNALKAQSRLLATAEKKEAAERGGWLSAQSGNLMLAVRLTGHDPERSLARPNSRTAAKP